jgi:hypothetical protein
MRLYPDKELLALIGAAGFTEPQITRIDGFQLLTATRPKPEVS